MKEQILYEDAKIEYRTNIKGWVGANKIFYGEDEHMARYANSNARRCRNENCENITRSQSYSICDICREKKALELYLSFPEVEWDRETPVFVFNDDTFFENEEQLIDYIESENIKEPLPLVLGEKQKVPKYNLDFLSEYIEDDHDIHPAIYDALYNLNKVVKDNLPIMYVPSSERVTYP